MTRNKKDILKDAVEREFQLVRFYARISCTVTLLFTDKCQQTSLLIRLYRARGQLHLPITWFGGKILGSEIARHETETLDTCFILKFPH